MLFHKTLEVAAKIYILEMKGYTTKQIARKLGISQNAVYKYYSDIGKIEFIIKDK